MHADRVYSIVAIAIAELSRDLLLSPTLDGNKKKFLLLRLSPFFYSCKPVQLVKTRVFFLFFSLSCMHRLAGFFRPLDA